jgi:D-xylose transport system permease protein
MTDPTPDGATPKKASRTLEIDTRLLGMIGAFVGALHRVQPPHRRAVPDPAQHLQPDDPDRLVAIMATGMVFVIVTRHIDLSVGSLLATCSAMMAMTQTVVVPQWLGLGLGTR